MSIENSTYNQRRKLDDHCSSCGKYIGNAIPRFCSKCKARQDFYKKNNSKPVLKERKPYNKLKSYQRPNEPWRMYLYEKYRMYGMSKLSEMVGVYVNSLQKHIFTDRVPIGDNYDAYISWFSAENRNDLLINLQSLVSSNKLTRI